MMIGNRTAGSWNSRAARCGGPPGSLGGAGHDGDVNAREGQEGPDSLAIFRDKCMIFYILDSYMT